ncbi:alpha-N-acetylglucosaminidase [Ophiocordyceps camponoti-floridani]|uniref:Alpha-N-acetylglucosaminidase n=1 Tax=Ophiocordyceps camponoti-floridani TaxID=2030778 RepID=A0A8H4VDP9_9HYPO|nr:alpha-N-acetylglucosaminidase [Ophiocordyceps camponoti-floridani]
MGGLRHYATEYLNLDDFWVFGPGRRLPTGPLPAVARTLRGTSVVPWRYNLNTVTFSYSFVWYDWPDWERLLDWCAWRGINVQLAWVGYESIYLDSFLALGLTSAEVLPFFSGPAFQAWNRFGNVHGSWGDGGGDLPLSWIRGQAKLQRRIVARMLELGITPVLPAFPGFVPDSLLRVRPGADVVRAGSWLGPGYENLSTLFLKPSDGVYAELQREFIRRQEEAYGNVSNVYTLDQFNEMVPPVGSDDEASLGRISRDTYASLTAANPAAVWMMQGWLFTAHAAFWTPGRIEAYLGAVEGEDSLVVLDLFAESEPLWMRTRSFASRPWVWCMLHNFGGNMNLYGRASAVVSGPARARSSSPSLVGIGLSPEAYANNEVIYDLVLDQAWKTTTNVSAWFTRWATLRYAGAGKVVPSSLLRAWQLLRTHVYDYGGHDIPSVGLGIWQLFPSLEGLVGRKGHAPSPTALHYEPGKLRPVWRLMVEAAREKDSLWNLPAFRLDFVDVSRQLLSNAFIDAYVALVAAFRAAVPPRPHLPGPNRSCSEVVTERSADLLRILDGLDLVLSSEPEYRLSTWLSASRRWADEMKSSEALLAFNARSQITVWMKGVPPLDDYSARAWAGLTSSYYRRRWAAFIDGLRDAAAGGGWDEAAVNRSLRAVEDEWQHRGFDADSRVVFPVPSVKSLVGLLEMSWPEVFAMGDTEE